MATEITMTLCCANCRNSRYEYAPGAFISKPHIYDCKLNHKYGHVCDRWLPVRKDIGNKIWKANQPAKEATT